MSVDASDLSVIGAQTSLANPGCLAYILKAQCNAMDLRYPITASKKLVSTRYLLLILHSVRLPKVVDTTRFLQNVSWRYKPEFTLST